MGLIAATLTGNHGAEAMAISVIGRLRERLPDLRFVLFSYYPQADCLAIADEQVHVASGTPWALVANHLPGALLGACLPKGKRQTSALLSDEARQLSTCDVLIDLAGVAFIDGREKFLPFNLLTLVPAMLLGVPVIKASQALGPFGGFANRLAARAILPRCSLIVARGKETKAHLDTIKLTEVLIAPDIAFLMHDSDRLVKTDSSRVDQTVAKMRAWRQSGRKVVGLCPSAVIYAKSGASYVDKLIALAIRVEADGHSVVVIPNATRSGTEGLRNNDLPVLRRIREGLNDLGWAGRAEFFDHDTDAVSIKRLISECDTMIVSRFHAMVGALSLAKPTVVLGWSHKYLEVMADFGLEDCVFDYADLLIEDLYPKVSSVIESSAPLSDKIASVLPDVRKRASVQIDAMAAIVSRR